MCDTVPCGVAVLQLLSLVPGGAVSQCLQVVCSESPRVGIAGVLGARRPVAFQKAMQTHPVAKRNSTRILVTACRGYKDNLGLLPQLLRQSWDPQPFLRSHAQRGPSVTGLMASAC